ncbi:MAG: DUF3106 domain-containing protein [Acidobacteriota bacterium]|nr:DUF3106 domain-containing protein [Acidobacteriota bacterium]
MLSRNTFVAVTLLTAGWAASPSAFAQGPRHMGGHGPGARKERPAKVPTPDKHGAAAQVSIDKFARMTPELRQKALAKLPPERAEKLRKQLNDYNQMTPQQQAAAREQLEAFRNLPPERQEGMRKAFSRFSRQPADRQQAIRQELNQLRALPEAERQARLSSSEFTGLFNNNERKIIRDMSDLPATLH